MGRAKFKGHKLNEPFVPIYRSVFEAPDFYGLSSFAAKLLLELISQYKGDNNGNLTAAWSLLKERGWRSKVTLWRAKMELIEAGFVYVTRKGRLPNTCELLALTWFPLDPTPKFDEEALTCFKPKAYRNKAPLPMATIKQPPDRTQRTGGRAPT